MFKSLAGVLFMVLIKERERKRKTKQKSKDKNEKGKLAVKKSFEIVYLSEKKYPSLETVNIIREKK